jgi:hypothetical protein
MWSVRDNQNGSRGQATLTRIPLFFDQVAVFGTNFHDLYQKTIVSSKRLGEEGMAVQQRQPLPSSGTLILSVCPCIVS